jgi:hypothetical protein
MTKHSGPPHHGYGCGCGHLERRSPIAEPGCLDTKFIVGDLNYHSAQKEKLSERSRTSLPTTREAEALTRRCQEPSLLIPLRTPCSCSTNFQVDGLET